MLCLVRTLITETFCLVPFDLVLLGVIVLFEEQVLIMEAQIPILQLLPRHLSNILSRSTILTCGR